jgi:aryl-alcohol dehydrogenase-like predicted oxidoreductase
MELRALGRTGVKVSPLCLGAMMFGAWGETDHDESIRIIHTALDAGINFIDTAPVYGKDAVGETMLADLIKSNRDDIVLTTKCGYDIDAERTHPGQSERPHDWRRESIRKQLDDSLRRLQTDRIELYQLHNARIEPVLDDDLWAELVALRESGKILELGVALGPAIGWVDEGLESLRRRPVASLQTVFNVLEQEPGRTFAAEPNVQDGSVGLISRVPHASDTLSGKVTPDTVFPKEDHRSHRNRDNMLDNFEKAETLRFLWEGTGRTIGQAAIAGILADPAFTTVLPTCVTPEEIVEYAGASDLPLSPDEKEQLDDLWSRNFDHEDRYVMPLKSSV